MSLLYSFSYFSGFLKLRKFLIRSEGGMSHVSLRTGRTGV